MKRVPTPELLDTDAGTPAEIAASLADLRMFNRWFGGLGTMRAIVERVAAQRRQPCFSLLEVAAGTGYVPQTTGRRVERDGVRLDITLLDRSRAHLNGSLPSVVGDALSLPFRDASFDLVGSTLFLHHLTPEDAARFVNESLRVCRVAVLINDLIRHPIHMGLVYAGFPLYRSRVTRHDAPASVRQAYTVPEMEEMLRRTGAARIELSRHYLFRMGAIAWKS